MLTEWHSAGTPSDEDSQGNLRGFVTRDSAIPDSQSIMTIDSSEDDEHVPVTPPCAQPAASLDTVYHRVVEEARLKRKAEQRDSILATDKSPLTPLVEVCVRERERQSWLDMTSSQRGCNFCAFTGFVPTLQGMLEDLKDYLVRAETGIAIADELVKKSGEGCVCPPSGDGQQSSKRRAFRNPFNTESARAASVASARKVPEDIDTSDSDDDVPLRRSTRAGRR